MLLGMLLAIMRELGTGRDGVSDPKMLKKEHITSVQPPREHFIQILAPKVTMAFRSGI